MVCPLSLNWWESFNQRCPDTLVVLSFLLKGDHPDNEIDNIGRKNVCWKEEVENNLALTDNDKDQILPIDNDNAQILAIDNDNDQNLPLDNDNAQILAGKTMAPGQI